jgi:hypothetical protein
MVRMLGGFNIAFPHDLTSRPGFATGYGPVAASCVPSGSINAGNFVTSCATISYSRSALLSGVGECISQERFC